MSNDELILYLDPVAIRKSVKIARVFLCFLIGVWVLLCLMYFNDKNAFLLALTITFPFSLFFLWRGYRAREKSISITHPVFILSKNGLFIHATDQFLAWSDLQAVYLNDKSHLIFLKNNSVFPTFLIADNNFGEAVKLEAAKFVIKHAPPEKTNDSKANSSISIELLERCHIPQQNRCGSKPNP